MTIIEASFVRVAGTLADGTLRLVVDVEPRNAQAAFALFNSPGTAMALAALKPIQTNDDDQPIEQKPKGGELSRLAGMWCNEPKFRDFLLNQFPHISSDNSSEAASLIYVVCGIESRAELDSNEQAAEKFHRLIRIPYSKWLKEHGN